MKLGGIVCIRNGDLQDYCWREAVQSLLPVCDMVTLCVGSGNTDATEHAAREWMAREPKIVVCIYPWPEPKGDANFWVDWLQYARQHTPTDFIFQLDADEVLSPESYPTIEQSKLLPGDFSLWCRRLNFWRDPQHLIPEGVCLAHRVIRYLPQNVFLPSDGADPRGAAATNMAVESPVEIFHYGFLREREAFFRKARNLQGMFFNDYDPRLQAAESFAGNWMEMSGVTGWEDRPTPFAGQHPKMMHRWLTDRGYKL